MPHQYYYQLLGQEYGPVSVTALQMLIRGGQLGGRAQVRKGDAGPWAEAISFPELTVDVAGDESALEELGDLSEIDADYSGGDAAELATDLSEIDVDYSGGESQVVSSRSTPSAGTGSHVAGTGPAVDDDRKWFCQLLGTEIGPLTMGDLKRMADQQELGPTDLVRTQDSEDWAPASLQLGELFPDASLDDLLAAAPDTVAGETAPPRTPVPARTPPPKPSSSEDDNDFELADNVSMIDAATLAAATRASAPPPPASPAPPAAQPPPPAAASASPPASNTEVSDDQYQGLDDDDDDPKDWESVLDGPVPETPAVPAAPVPQPAAPVSQPPGGGYGDGTQSAASDLINRAAASMHDDVHGPSGQSSGGGMSMPDLPVAALIKVAGAIAVCALLWFVFTNLPTSTDLPGTYNRLATIYGDYEQIAGNESECARYIEELEDVYVALNESASLDNAAELSLTFAVSELLTLLSIEDEEMIKEQKSSFLGEMSGCRLAYESQGGDISGMPDLGDE